MTRPAPPPKRPFRPAEKRRRQAALDRALAVVKIERHEPDSFTRNVIMPRLSDQDLLALRIADSPGVTYKDKRASLFELYDRGSDFAWSLNATVFAGEMYRREGETPHD